MALDGVMWVEKHRPRELGEIAGQEDIVGSLEALAAKPAEMPHLLLAGSPGTGKTTAAMCLCRRVLGDAWRDHALELNASDERGIAMVRERVKTFSRYAGMGGVPFRVIILDEADEMTSDAQTALRRIIEDTARHCRFIIIANNLSRIIEPIQSRCAVFRFTAVPEGAIKGRLAQIAKKEGAKAAAGGIDEILAASGGDLRHAVNMMQVAAALPGGITAANARAAAGLTAESRLDEVLKLALSGKVARARELVIEMLRVNGLSGADILRGINAAVNRAAPEGAEELVRAISEYDYRILVGASPEIQLSAMLYELGAIAEKK